MTRPRRRRGLAPIVWSPLDQALFVVALALLATLGMIALFRLVGLA